MKINSYRNYIYIYSFYHRDYHYISHRGILCTFFSFLIIQLQYNSYRGLALVFKKKKLALLSKCRREQ